MKFTTLKNSKNTMRAFMMCGVSFLSLSLVGCDLYTEGSLNTQQIMVKEEMFHDDVAVADVDDAYIEALANGFYKYGDGMLDIAVTYDPHSKVNTAMEANQNVSDITSSLRKAGIYNVKGSILPVSHQGDVSRMAVSYMSYSAKAPDDCGQISGLSGKGLDYDPEYRFGCSVDTMIAKQVSRPRDLAGRSNTDQFTDGRASANIVDTYRLGAPNKPLDGESATAEK